MAQLECALLSSNFDDIEKYSEKLKKKREISASLEIVLDCYVGIHRQIRLHAASLELDLSHLMAYQIKPDASKKLKDKLMKVLMMDIEGGSELELKLAYVLLGLLSLFSASESPKESLSNSMTFFDKIDFDLTKKFLLYEQGDTEITQSSLIEKIFGILGLYFRGVGLELQGRKEDACDLYQVITDFIFRFRVQQFCQARSVFDFICAALYRSGCLLNQLAQFKDSASIFRSFLNFYQVNNHSLISNTNATVRLLRALAQYMDLLDRKFRKYNFKTFCDEQHSIYNVRGAETRDSSMWQAENVQEELILCCMLYEGIEQGALVKQILEDLRLEGNVLRRFARIGYLEGITRIQKSHFQTKVSDLSIYRNLFHSLMSSGKLDQAVLSGKMYLQGHGKDPFTLMLIAKLYLRLPSKLDESFVILSGIDCEALEAGMQVPYFILRGQYHLIKSRFECQFELSEFEAQLKLAESQFLLVLQVDPDNAEAHFFLSLTSSDLGEFEEAERWIKKSLSLDSSQIRAWNLFALLKSANKDYQSVLNICNTELSNMMERDLNLSLLRVSALMALNRSDEAIENLKRIISAHFQPSNDFKMDGGMTVISEGTLGPGNFLSKFLGDLSGGGYYGGGDKSNSSRSINTENTVNGNVDLLLGLGKSTTFVEYAEAFPSSLNEYLSSKTVFDDSKLSVDDVLAISPRSASSNITSLWIEVARVYLQEGLLQDAEAAVNQAFLGNEIYSPIYGTFGLIEEHRNNNIEATEVTEMFYRKGLSIDEKDETCLLGLARVLLLTSKTFESERLVRCLIQSDPSVAEAWSLLAQCCSRSGRTEEALKYFEIALKKESQRTLRSIRSISVL